MSQNLSQNSKYPVSYFTGKIPTEGLVGTMVAAVQQYNIRRMILLGHISLNVGDARVRQDLCFDLSDNEDSRWTEAVNFCFMQEVKDVPAFIFQACMRFDTALNSVLYKYNEYENTVGCDDCGNDCGCDDDDDYVPSRECDREPTEHHEEPAENHQSHDEHNDGPTEHPEEAKEPARTISWD